MMNAATIVRLVCVGVSAAAMLGCMTEAPRLRVVDARVVERTEAGVVVEFVVEGENSNEDELPLGFVRYAVDLDGRRVFSGERSAEATLRRAGAQRFTLPASFAWGEGVDASGVRAYRLSGDVDYIASDKISELLFDIGAHRPRASFSGSGEIELGE